jgi:hypothetical protein
VPALTITTTTSGVELDPDGYTIQIDGHAAGPVGVQATLTIDPLPDGQHSIELSGLAANCSVSGPNPQTATTQAGATARVTFAVVCGPTTGTLEVVTTSSGQPADPDGYVIVLDGAPKNPIGTSAVVSLPGVATGLHTVELSGVAINCQVTGDHPLGVAVLPAETARVSFTITCVPTAGELAVTVSGLPAGTFAAVTVTGPNSFSRPLTGTTSLTGLAPGSYTVTAANVVAGATTYKPSTSRPSVQVVAGATTTVTVSYTAVANVTLNLRIDGLYLTQSTQTYSSSVPLVADRPAYLRVFVIANQTNTAKPGVRVQLSGPGGLAQTYTIAAPGETTPTQVQEGTLNSSWNLPIPASLIKPGLSIVAEVDPNGVIGESNEGDNRFPATGTKALTVQSVPLAKIRFVSIQQGAGVPGNVSAANKDQLMDLARRIHPLNAVDIDVHPSVFTTSTTLEANGNGWAQVLGDLDALRVADASDRTYFGIAKLSYGRQDGQVGLAFQGTPTALGWDDASDASRVVAHELGHTWGRRHTLCGSPPAGTIDLLYPYPNGQIGVNGLDVTDVTPKPATSPDIMGYCFQNPWISDYNYRAEMTFRGPGAGLRMAAAPQPALLLWGRIVNGRPVLEPAFEIVTRPSLPTRPGPYSITATASDGARLLTLSFAPTTAADDPQGGSYFAFAVPLDRARADRLASVQLSGPGGMVATSRPATTMQTGAPPAPVGRREGRNVVIQWNASVNPTIMVRDPDTGEVLSFARGGTARVSTGKDQLDLELSDGVRSQRLRLAINR